MAKKATRVKDDKVVKGEVSYGAIILERTTAVYVGDSTNYHIYQIADGNGKKVVGTLYFSKDDEAPSKVVVSLLTPAHGKWRGIVEKLKGKAKEGSKNYNRLTSILAG